MMKQHTIAQDYYTAVSSAHKSNTYKMTLLACAYLSVQYLLALERANFLWALGVAAVAEPLVLQSLGGSHLTAVAVGLLVVQAALAAIILSLSFRSAASPRAVGAAA